MASLFEQGSVIRYHPLGHYQVSVDKVTAISLPSPPSPSKVRRVMIRVNKDWRWRDDGVAPDSVTGMYHLADEALIYDSVFVSLQLILSSSSVSSTGFAYVAYHGID